MIYVLVHCGAEDAVDYHSSKHQELSEQLATWWRTQTSFETKKALADFLQVHPDTLGDYFSGSKFPRSDIASRLWELTNIACLQPRTSGDSPSGMVPEASSAVMPAVDVGASMDKPQGTESSGLSPVPKQEHRPSENAGATARQLPRELFKKGERQGERAVIISVQRTSCPLCAHDITKFGSCVYCGQHFVLANVPIEQDKPL